jgi:AraC-like DNA-binding protein
MGALRPTALWPLVRSMRHYDIAGMPPGVHIGMPSATVTLVIPLGAPLDLAMPAIGRRAMTSCVSGLHDGPAAIHHDGTQRGLQLDLAPLGVRTLFGVPAADLAHTAVGLDSVLGDRQADRLLDQLACAPDWPHRLALLERYLSLRLRGHRPALPRPEVAHAWAMLARTGGTARIGDVASEVGWSTRHLADQFTAAVGATPKTVARLLRFSRSVRMIGRGALPGDAAARCGYADQAHLTREWRRMAGTTPSRWPHQDALANVQDTTGRAPAASTA